MQTTIAQKCIFKGVGLHSGKPATLAVHPAPVDHGIVFRRVDVKLGDNILPALWHGAEHSQLCTKLVNGSGASVSTIEHVMAALAGCGIHNAMIDVDGPEVPILDGSAIEFVRTFLSSGLRQQTVPVQVLKILKPVRVERGDAWAEFRPSDTPMMTFHIDFSDAAIGVQKKSLNLSNGSFVRELCASRTFCRFSEVDYMRKNGLALGGTFENAVVVDGDQILSPGGLRHSDEAVRHKMLDALGDIYLAGAPILGHYHGYKAGHTLTNVLLRALFADETAFSYVTSDATLAARLPGAGVHFDEIVSVA